MKQRNVRLTSDDEKQLATLFAFYGVSGGTDSERIRDFVHKAHKSLLAHSVSKTLSDPTAKAEIDADILDCKLRIRATLEKPKSRRVDERDLTETVFFCVNRPPRATRLISTQICQVCKAIKYNLKNSAPLIEETEQETETEQQGSPQAAPTKYGEQPTPKITHKLIFDWQHNAFVQKTDGSRRCPFHNGYTMGLGFQNVWLKDC